MTPTEIKQNKAAWLEKKLAHAGEKWRKHYTQRVLTAARLAQGELIRIDKLTLQTDFCFGHGWNGISTEEEEDNAAAAEKEIHESERVFTAENTEPAEKMLQQLAGYRPWPHKFQIVVTQDGESHLDWVDAWGWGFADMDKAIEHYSRFGPVSIRELAQEDIPALVAAYRAQKDDITKRCKSYWKRYGGSKLNTWTYLRD
ncbi:MAG: hypothetical protein IKZ07_05490 [Akkermansia sp.]|nr:hypothetical protein [Akkermansia sp.]